MSDKQRIAELQKATQIQRDAIQNRTPLPLGHIIVSNQTLAEANDALSKDIDIYNRERGSGYAKADLYVIEVGQDPKPTNYEGNVIAYIYMRAKGTDNVSIEKITMQCPNNQFTVVDERQVQ